MLYPLFQFFDELDIPGTGVFRYISFRSSMALIFSLFTGAMTISLVMWFIGLNK